MENLHIIPGKKFLEVLEELHHLRDAPKVVQTYFNSKQHCTINKKQPVKTVLQLTPRDVKWCHMRMREHGHKYRIHELLNESRLELPHYEPPARSPELEARIERLKAEQFNLEYKRMTENIRQGAPSLGREVSSVGQELRALHRDINRQLVTGLQYLVSIIGTFFALFVGLGFATSELAPRLIIAVIGSVVVMLAEIYFIIREDVAKDYTRIKKNN